MGEEKRTLKKFANSRVQFIFCNLINLQQQGNHKNVGSQQLLLFGTASSQKMNLPIALSLIDNERVICYY